MLAGLALPMGRKDRDGGDLDFTGKMDDNYYVFMA